MPRSKRIFMVTGTGYNPAIIFRDQMLKLCKGFIRLGNDVCTFNYGNALLTLSPFKSRSLSSFIYKSRTDELLANQIGNYKPDVVLVNFPRFFDSDTVERIRGAAPNAVLVGVDGDPWPKLQRNRIETARHLDMVAATNDGSFLQDYRDAGVPLCVFMPNFCDPDVDYRYDVADKWKTDILWIGTLKHQADSSEKFREKLIKRLAKQKNCTLYGCCGRPKIGGMDCLYAISGARIGVSVNAYGPVRLCHSDRLTRYLACGTFALARRFPDCDMLYRDGEHLRYFDSMDEFFDLADWYLAHEEQRRKTADAGMKWIHEQFNCVKIAGYFLELIAKGTYSASWFPDL